MCVCVCVCGCVCVGGRGVGYMYVSGCLRNFVDSNLRFNNVNGVADVCVCVGRG